MTKLSLTTILTMSVAFAGGDIAPVAPEAITPVTTPVESCVACNNSTTISSKAQLYYYTHNESGKRDLFKAASSTAAGAVTFNVTHKLTSNVAANFSTVGYANLTNKIGRQNFEQQGNGAFVNVANLTATFTDTTF